MKKVEGVMWVNGALLPVDKASLNPRDRGFTLGDGLFETMRARTGCLPWAGIHLTRLRTGVVAIGLPDIPDDAVLIDAIYETLEANRLSEAVVRLTISRGVPARRGLLPEPGATPTLVIDAQPFAGYPPSLYARGMRAITSRIQRNERSPLTKIKTLNCLDNVLARREAHGCGKDEAILLNTTGHLACASAANLFLVSGNSLITPSTASGALRGTMRELVLTEVALRTGLTATERHVGPDELAAADEAFLTSALLGVMPLTAVDRRLIGEGMPGPVSTALGKALEKLWCERLDNLSGQVGRQGGPDVEQIRERQDSWFGGENQ